MRLCLLRYSFGGWRCSIFLLGCRWRTMMFFGFLHGSQGKNQTHRTAGFFFGDATENLIDLRTIQVIFYHLVSADNGQHAV